MTIQQIKNTLTELFKSQFKTPPTNTQPLPRSGSDRIYFRLSSNEHSVIGAYNEDLKENEAFFSFTKTFKKLNINVPSLLEISTDRKHYLISDLGNETLFHTIQNNNVTTTGKSTLCYLKKSLEKLIDIQLEGAKNIDFTKCYPREAFDRQAIHWDLNYFKYEFLKLASISFDEQKLEDDFNTLANYLLSVNSNYFMFRDFQSRNIMIIENEPWFIDYQGGRKGPLQYDLASLLFSPKTALNNSKKEILLDFYTNKLGEKMVLNKDEFIQQYYGFVLIRILQALGAYGFRGLYEKKSNFRRSIPQAIQNLNYLLNNKQLPIHLPEIERIIHTLQQSKWAKIIEIPSDKLTLRVSSFSYKKGIPDDPSDNGGGFAFDCRGLPNPGRLEEYKAYSGLDENVQTYLEKYDEVIKFQQNIRQLVEISLKEYIKRGFNHLCVNFGCTGGQHRSVYNAEKFATWAANNFPVNVVITHNEMNNWKRDE
ncbi:MAG: phosphotransferase enzyme family protein [Prolixibacteraceae bacterium]|jgi:aminoglycoside/choline kinase family phosphotransferase|nr:phosphotransferase enzyme family protein [Prolixibacteraceae bacterium]